MTKRDWKLVQELAAKSRTWTEKKATELVQSNGDWAIDKDTLCGMCAIASAHLFTALQKACVPVELWSNSRHCFLIVEDSVVDITATQFGKSRIFIASVWRVKHDTRWAPELMHASVESLRVYQTRSGWPPPQCVPTTL